MAGAGLPALLLFRPGSFSDHTGKEACRETSGSHPYTWRRVYGDIHSDVICHLCLGGCAWTLHVSTDMLVTRAVQHIGWLAPPQARDLSCPVNGGRLSCCHTCPHIWVLARPLRALWPHRSGPHGGAGVISAPGTVLKVLLICDQGSCVFFSHWASQMIQPAPSWGAVGDQLTASSGWVEAKVSPCVPGQARDLSLGGGH